jgi:hypothetical protein
MNAMTSAWRDVAVNALRSAVVSGPVWARLAGAMTDASVPSRRGREIAMETCGGMGPSR